MYWMTHITFISAAIMLVPALVYVYLYYRDREIYLGLWSLGWFVYILGFAFELKQLFYGQSYTALALNNSLVFLTGLLFLWGFSKFSGDLLPRLPVYLLAAIIGWASLGMNLDFSYPTTFFPLYLLSGAIYIWVGIKIWRFQKFDKVIIRVMGLVFVLLGIHRIDYIFFWSVPTLAQSAYLISSILQLPAAASFLLMYNQRVQMDLQVSEERFRLLAENAKDMVFRYRLKPEPGFEYVSPSLTTIIGHTPEEFYANRDIGAKLIHPDDFPVANNVVNSSASGNGAVTMRCINKGGATIWIELRSTNIYDETGTVVAIEGIARDVTDRKEAEDALKEKEELYRSLVEMSPDAVTLTDLKGNIIMTSQRTVLMHGFDGVTDMVGRNAFEFVAPEDRQRAKSDLRAVFEAESIRGLEYALIKSDGTTFFGELSVSLIMDPEGNPKAVLALCRDITERKLTEDQLWKLSYAIEQSPSMVIVTNTQGIIEYVNPKFVELSGYAYGEIIGKIPHMLEPAESSLEQHEQFLDAFIIGKGWKGEFRCRKKDNDFFWVSSSISPIKNSEGVIVNFLVVLEDTTDKKRAEETINYMAYYDALTGLPNRSLFYDRLSLAIVRAHRNSGMVSILYLDLDNFKTVNDTLGHEIGDQLLAEVSRRIVGCLSDGDTVARFGGDEFVILLMEINSVEDSVIIARKILEVLSPQFNIEDHELYISTSIGVSFYPYDGNDVRTLLKNAEVALYRAKEQGRNRYQLYTPAMNEKALERLAMENSIRKAMEREEFVVYYQPQIDLGSGQIVGMEALLRWQHCHQRL